MKRKEAWSRIDAIIAKHEVDDIYVTITNVSDYDALRYARKALEQEPILDKIRAEIKQLPYQRIFGKVSSYSLLDTVIEIIDKYRQEG